jgi:hypothetical protein
MMDEPGRFYRWDEIEIPEPKPITYREKKAIYERDGGRCYLCGDDVPYRLALSLNGMRWRDERYADLLREVSDED